MNKIKATMGPMTFSLETPTGIIDATTKDFTMLVQNAEDQSYDDVFGDGGVTNDLVTFQYIDHEDFDQIKTVTGKFICGGGDMDGNNFDMKIGVQTIFPNMTVAVHISPYHVVHD